MEPLSASSVAGAFSAEEPSPLLVPALELPGPFRSFWMGNLASTSFLVADSTFRRFLVAVCEWTVGQFGLTQH